MHVEWRLLLLNENECMLHFTLLGANVLVCRLSVHYFVAGRPAFLLFSTLFYKFLSRGVLSDYYLVVIKFSIAILAVILLNFKRATFTQTIVHKKNL